MACETYLKIAQKCKEEFVKLQPSEEEPYVCVVIRTLSHESVLLEQHQKLIFFEAVGHMVSEEPNLEMRGVLLTKLMEELDLHWKEIMQETFRDVLYLKMLPVIKDIDFYIRVNQAVASTVGHIYYAYLGNNYNDILNVYKFYSALISEQLKAGASMEMDAAVKTLKVIRKNILKLIQTFVQFSEDSHLLSSMFVPPLSQLMLDYGINIPDARWNCLLFA